MKVYQCPSCSSRVFYENLQCLNCGAELGYVAELDAIQVVQPPENQHEQALSVCGNRQVIGCNWLTVATGATQSPVSGGALCDCCRYTHTFPSLDHAENRKAWCRFEQAKRYLFRSLKVLQLPIPDRVQQPENGLVFEFLEQSPATGAVLTGHVSGVITINVAEAGDIHREQQRLALHEPYRTLLGHLRHEVGHFYWMQLLSNNRHLPEFRRLFGDERADYAAALQQHYQNADSDNDAWHEHYISHYASAHPWEDWAETWAHYLHINDGLDTAAHWRVDVAGTVGAILPSSQIGRLSDAQFKDCVLRQWLPLCQYLNVASRSLGETDVYPFILSPVVIEKLGFVHSIVRANLRRA